ncbi:hypothetical protein [Bythopirellula goksoeyrii]|uniref:Uncharacterized protein n=1 Tax=Bythopirellula goksoeyrii TaxID=1400387 RepID=A0A5B9Q6P2_9BACT|nr:hypothetical protein [Bythopirellula goksoeyrii]QEG33370.1 hypothetical protein Pr1d_06310 [Bythopirellula goksoeyrii]
MNKYPIHHESIWMLTIAPTIWALHFLLCYITAAVWCSKYAGDSSSLHSVRIAIGVYTAVALSCIAVIGWIGFTRHRRGGSEIPHDQDLPEDRHRFLGFATLLLSALSAVATLFVASVALFIENCD